MNIVSLRQLLLTSEEGLFSEDEYMYLNTIHYRIQIL